MRTLLLLTALLSTSLFAQNCTTDCAFLSGHSWLDENGNGIRDIGEPPVDGVVLIVGGNSTRLDSALAINGFYSFPNLSPNRYLVQFMPDTNNITTTLRMQGDDPARDSDPVEGRTTVQVTLGRVIA